MCIVCDTSTFSCNGADVVGGAADVCTMWGADDGTEMGADVGTMWGADDGTEMGADDGTMWGADVVGGAADVSTILGAEVVACAAST